MLPPFCPCHLWWVRGLTLPLTNCSTWESGPCTLPGQHSRADPIQASMNYPKNMSMGDLALPYGGVRERCSHLALCDGWES